MIELANPELLPQLYQLRHDVIRNQLRGTAKIGRNQRRIAFRGKNARPSLALQNVDPEEVASFVRGWKRKASNDGYVINIQTDGHGCTIYCRVTPGDTIEMQVSEEILRRAHRTPVEPR